MRWTIDLRNAPDEFIGVAASFIEAGFPAVVAPLWPVPAGTTLTIAELFFNNYQQNHCASSALRQAQIAIKNGQSVDSQVGDSQSLGFRRKQQHDHLTDNTYVKLASLSFVCYGG